MDGPRPQNAPRPGVQHTGAAIVAHAKTPPLESVAEDRQLSHLDDHVIESPVSPVYWNLGAGRGRSISYQSIGGDRREPIALEDHSLEDDHQSQSCWARSATVDDYTLISGTTGIGAYVVWHCTVKTLKGGDMVIRKR